MNRIPRLPGSTVSLVKEEDLLLVSAPVPGVEANPGRGVGCGQTKKGPQKIRGIGRQRRKITGQRNAQPALLGSHLIYHHITYFSIFLLCHPLRPSSQPAVRNMSRNEAMIRVADAKNKSNLTPNAWLRALTEPIMELKFDLLPRRRNLDGDVVF